MEKRFEHIDDIIAKFLAGEATQNEIDILNQWKLTNEENRKEFEQFSKLYDKTGKLKVLLPVDTDKAWIKVKDSIAKSKHLNVMPVKARANWSPLLRIAAVLLVVAGIAYSLFVLNSGNDQKLVTVNTSDKVQKSELPDGSTVTLNKNSSLSYSSGLFSKKRTVQLKGEAYFDVKHDESNPFVVEAGGLKIQDVGTSFNVKVNENSEFVVISVVSGIVKVTAVNNEELLLNEGDEATYNVHSGALSKTGIENPNISAYANRVFIFENAELKTVFNILNDVYDVKLKPENDSLLGCRITVTFDNETIEEISNVIAETLGLEIEKTENTITFKGNGCKQ